MASRHQDPILACNMAPCQNVAAAPLPPTSLNVNFQIRNMRVLQLPHGLGHCHEIIWVCLQGIVMGAGLAGALQQASAAHQDAGDQLGIFVLPLTCIFAAVPRHFLRYTCRLGSMEWPS